MRHARTVFGGSLTDGRPQATIAIIAVCVVVFLAQQVVPEVTSRVAFVPALGESEPWRFVLSAFAHGDLLHIGLNLYGLWLMGTYLEPMLGRARFVTLHLLSALGGSVMYLLLSAPPSTADLIAGDVGTWSQGAVGASGAVFGLFGAYIVLQRRLKRSASGMYVLIGINAVIGFIPGLNIAWQAHLGGLVTGAAAAAAVAYLGRSRTPMQPGNRQVQWAGLVAVGLLLVVVATIRYATV
ncbi:MAG: rhomboid family intramembrane serine protease [Dermatophilaceae bacterium]